VGRYFRAKFVGGCVQEARRFFAAVERHDPGVALPAAAVRPNKKTSVRRHALQEGSRKLIGRRREDSLILARVYVYRLHAAVFGNVDDAVAAGPHRSVVYDLQLGSDAG